MNFVKKTNVKMFEKDCFLFGKIRLEMSVKISIDVNQLLFFLIQIVRGNLNSMVFLKND